MGASPSSRKSALLEALRTLILILTAMSVSDLAKACLSTEFDLSRTPLREALREIAGHGYVELTPSRGARVVEMSHTTLRDFFLAALMVYGAILRLAAIHALPGQIDAFKHEQIEFRAALTSSDVATKALADNRFHAIRGDMAGNTSLRPSFHRLLIDYTRISMPLSHVTQRWLPSLPKIIGTGTMRAPDSFALATGAREMGADAILLGTLPYSVPTKRENALSALANDRAANLPVMLYNYPGRMGVNMGGEFLDRVGRLRNFCAIKENSGDIIRVHLLARDYPHIQMSCGMDDQTLEFFA